MPVISTWEDVEAAFGTLEQLTEAEQKLIKAALNGTECTLGEGDQRGQRPARAKVTSQRKIRAEILRYLILGGCPRARVADWGVRLTGAFIEGRLDISHAATNGATKLAHCRFSDAFDAHQSEFRNLDLTGSKMHALELQGSLVHGDLLLKDIHVTALTSLSGATIEGQLDCAGATFDAEGRDAFDAQDMKVSQGFFWRGVTISDGCVDLTMARVGALSDEVDCWPPRNQLFLDGFVYDRIAGATTDPKARIEWLKKGTSYNDTFHPQPYTQLAKVLQDLGHDADARQILVRREHKLREHERSIASPILRPLLFARDWLLQRVVGYGYLPFRSIGVLVGLIVLTWIPAYFAWDEGSMAPNAAPIIVSPEWKAFAGDPNIPNPALCWSKAVPGKDWESFHSFAYAADVVIPIINFGQTDAWAPSTERGQWGWHLWWMQWMFTLLGWIVTALGAAAISGFVSRD